MEPPAKRTKTGPSKRQDDEADDDDELSLTPSQFAARQDPLYELDKGRAKAASKLKSRFENIFEKYAQDFDGIGDEINLHTGEVAIDNGHLKSLEDDKAKKCPSGDEEEQEEEHILQPKRKPSQALSLAPRPSPPALSPADNAAVAFLQQSGWTPPPGFNADLSTLSGLSAAPQLFGTPNPLGFANSLFGSGSAPADPLWQTPELQIDSPLSRLGPFGAGYTPQDGQRRVLSQLFAHHTQRKTTSVQSLSLKRKKLLEGALTEGEENSKQDGKTGDSVVNSGDHDDDEDDLLLGASPNHKRPAPLPKKAAKGTAASLAAESSGSAEVETDPVGQQDMGQQDKTQRLPKGPKKPAKSDGKQTSMKQQAETIGTTGKRKKAAAVPVTLPAFEDKDKSRDTAALATAEPVRKRKGRPPKSKRSVGTRVQQRQPEERNHDASDLAAQTTSNEAEPEPGADALPEIHDEKWDEEAVNAQLMQAVNEALLLVTSPMRAWPQANFEKEDATNGSLPEHQDTDMPDAMSPSLRARSLQLLAPAGINTEADEPATAVPPKEIWSRNRIDPSFAFSDEEDEVDFQQSWGPPGDNNPDLFKDASPEAPALATDVAGAADPVEDPVAVTVPETRHHEPGRDEPSYVDTAPAPLTEGVSEIIKSSSVTTLEINHSPSPNVEAEAEAEAESLETSTITNGVPATAESPKDEARENEKARAPPPKRRGRPPHGGRVPKARVDEASLEALANTDDIPTTVDAAKADARENENAQTTPPKRRGRPSHKGRVSKVRTTEPESPPAGIAGSAKDRAPEPQSPPADFSSLSRDRVAEQPEPPSASHSASPRTRDTPRHRKDRPTGSHKNPAPKSTERRPSQTPVQEGERAESAKKSPSNRAKRRRSALTSLVPDLSDDDDVDEVDTVWSQTTPNSSSFTSNLHRAAAHTAHPSPKTPLHATSRRHSLLFGSARPRPSPASASATHPVAGSSSSARRRGSSGGGKLAGSAHNSPLLERVLKTTPRDGSGGGWHSAQGERGAVASGDTPIRTPGGTARRCGVDGFVCARDFCFACCK